MIYSFIFLCLAVYPLCTSSMPCMVGTSFCYNYRTPLTLYFVNAPYFGLLGARILRLRYLLVDPLILFYFLLAADPSLYTLPCGITAILLHFLLEHSYCFI
jgi:hypothetical protein